MRGEVTESLTYAQVCELRIEQLSHHGGPLWGKDRWHLAAFKFSGNPSSVQVTNTMNLLPSMGLGGCMTPGKRAVWSLCPSGEMPPDLCHVLLPPAQHDLPGRLKSVQSRFRMPSRLSGLHPSCQGGLWLGWENVQYGSILERFPYEKISRQWH